ncbi:MAG TPA: hypothetical protein V6D23_22295 [Candidatus Obscuribacterales bacterium]
MTIPELSQPAVAPKQPAPAASKSQPAIPPPTSDKPPLEPASPKGRKDQITVSTGKAGMARTSASFALAETAAPTSTAATAGPADVRAAKARATVDTAIRQLGLSMEMQTDPKVMQEVLAGMKLLDFETSYPPMKAFLAAAKSEPQPLGPLLTAIREGIVADHPAIVEFLDRAIQENWLTASDEIKTSAYTAFILEAMTAAMANNNGFAKEVQAHFLKKRAEYGIQTNSALDTFWKVYRATDSMFEAAKTVSVDPAITFYRISRDRQGKPLSKEEVEQIYAGGSLTYPEKQILMPAGDRPAADEHNGLCINIYEAATTEFKQGYTDNAMSAHALCESTTAEPHPQVFKKGAVLPKSLDNAFYRSLADKENSFPTTDFSQDWVSLYETWNMAFILSELDDLHILFPKLLIPSVLSANKENYLATRVMALWLSINTIMFRKLDHVEAVKGPAHKAEMAKAWGEINKKYALALAQESAGENPAEFKKGFDKHFKWPTYDLMKRLANY